MSLHSVLLTALLAFAPAQDVPPPETSPAAVAATSVPEVTPDELILGPIDAPVTLIAYISAICPNCAKWHAEVLPRIIENQIATGRIRLVLRQAPTRPAIVSEPAAGIVYCASSDKRVDVIAALFENLPAMEEDRLSVLDWHLVGVASSGRTREEMDTCLADTATLLAVRSVADGAIAGGALSVPAFFVNGTLVSDDSVDGLEAAIEAAMPTG